MMRCFQVIVLIYSSIHIKTGWHVNIFAAFSQNVYTAFDETSFILCTYLLIKISGLMMNILIMQTIRPIIAFYFIFLFMLIRHSSSNKTVAIASYSITIRQIICLNEVFYFSSQTTFQNST